VLSCPFRANPRRDTHAQHDLLRWHSSKSGQYDPVQRLRSILSVGICGKELESFLLYTGGRVIPSCSKEYIETTYFMFTCYCWFRYSLEEHSTYSTSGRIKALYTPRANFHSGQITALLRPIPKRDCWRSSIDQLRYLYLR